MSRFFTGETILWVCFAVFLLGIIFNPKPLKQIAAEGWARSISNLKWAAPIFAGIAIVFVALIVYIFATSTH